FAFWKNILDDDVPVIVLLGDYYLFGEMNEHGQVNRLVRDFEIDSRQDLDLYVNEDLGWRERFVDVDLHYLPIGAAKALSPLLPILDKPSGKAVIKTMSELRTADLASNHIVYLGLLSGLGNLHDLMFAASGLYIGATFDELYSIESGDY